MKNIIKKNQLMITALAIMMAIAGYLQFAGVNPKEDKLTVNDPEAISSVGSGGVITENYNASDLSKQDSMDQLVDEIFDISDEDLATLSGEETGLVEIPSLDTDDLGPVENYLSQDMPVDSQTAGNVPKEGTVPGEAVFTASSGIEVLSDAKLLKEQTRARNKETLLSIINSVELGDEQKQEAVNGMVRMTEVAEKEAAAEILLEAKGFEDVVVSISWEGVDVVVNAVELSDAQRAQIGDIVKRKAEVEAQDIIISTVVND